ncbi:MAG TPA: chemotaxis protein CheW [Gammaproteobacteria bacterium]
MADTGTTLRSSEKAASAGEEAELIVRCLLMPFHGFNLLMPNTAVAEVVAYEKPKAVDQAPGWLKGFVAWRGRSVPVVSLENLMGSTEGTPGSQARLIIFNALGEGAAVPFIAMVAQGIPRLHALKEENLHYVPGSQKHEAGVLTRLLLDGNPVVVPDLEVLEKMLLQIGVREGK